MPVVVALKSWEAGRSEVQVHLRQHAEFDTSLVYKRPCLRNKTEIVNMVNFILCVFFHYLKKKDFLLYADSFRRARAIGSHSVCSTAGT